MSEPRGEYVVSTTPKPGYENARVIGVPEIEIAAWCPDKNAAVAPTRVHLIFKMFHSPVIVQFKSPDTLGFIIEELIRYRRYVWRKCAPIKGEEAIDGSVSK